jgi:hypothetical protein
MPSLRLSRILRLRPLPPGSEDYELILDVFATIALLVGTAVVWGFVLQVNADYAKEVADSGQDQGGNYAWVLGIIGQLIVLAVVGYFFFIIRLHRTNPRLAGAINAGVIAAMEARRIHTERSLAAMSAQRDAQNAAFFANFDARVAGERARAEAAQQQAHWAAQAQALQHSLAQQQWQAQQASWTAQDQAIRAQQQAQADAQRIAAEAARQAVALAQQQAQAAAHEAWRRSQMPPGYN